MALPYSRNSTNAITELLMRQGELAAQRREQQGQIWGNAIQQAGQAAGAAFEQYRQNKVQREREAKFNDLLGSWDGQDDQGLTRRMVSLLGPSEGLRVASGLIANRNATQKAELDPKDFAAKIGAIRALKDKMGGDYLQRNWSGISQNLAPYAKQYLGVDITPDFKPEYAQTLDILDDKMNPRQKKSPVSVAPGSSLVDPDTGQTIYTAPPKAETPKAPDTQSFGGKVWQFNPQTQKYDIPLGATEASLARAAKQSTGEEKPKARALPSGPALQIGEITAAQKLAENLKAEGSGSLARAGAALPNVVTEVTGLGTAAKKRQGQIKLAKQIIGKGLEGGVLRKEDEIKYEQILPTISDSEEVAQSKLDGLKIALESKLNATLDSLEDAGYDTSRYRARRATPGSGPETDADTFLRNRGR